MNQICEMNMMIYQKEAYEREIMWYHKYHNKKMQENVKEYISAEINNQFS